MASGHWDHLGSPARFEDPDAPHASASKGQQQQLQPGKNAAPGASEPRTSSCASSPRPMMASGWYPDARRPPAEGGEGAAGGCLPRILPRFLLSALPASSSCSSAFFTGSGRLSAGKRIPLLDTSDKPRRRNQVVCSSISGHARTYVPRTRKRKSQKQSVRVNSGANSGAQENAVG